MPYSVTPSEIPRQTICASKVADGEGARETENDRRLCACCTISSLAERPRKPQWLAGNAMDAVMDTIVVLKSNACTHIADMVEYECRQSPRMLSPGGRRGCIGAGLTAIRPVVVRRYSFPTSSRLPSDRLFFRLRRCLSRNSRAKSAHPGKAVAISVRISFSIRQAPPFVGAARIGPCRHGLIISQKANISTL